MLRKVLIFPDLDHGSQELLEAVVRERNIRLDHARTTTIFHHPALGDFEVQDVGTFKILLTFHE